MFHVNDIGMTAYLDRADVEKVVTILQTAYPLVRVAGDSLEFLDSTRDADSWTLEEFIRRHGTCPSRLIVVGKSVTEYSSVTVSLDRIHFGTINVQWDKYGTTSLHSQQVGRQVVEFLGTRSLRPRYLTSSALWLLLSILAIFIFGVTPIGLYTAILGLSVATGIRLYRYSLPPVHLVSPEDARRARTRAMFPALVAGILVAAFLVALVATSVPNASSGLNR